MRAQLSALRQRVAATITCLTLAALVLHLSAAHADGGDLLDAAPFDGISPEGITYDSTDDSFWVTSFVDGEILHYDAGFNLLATLDTPFAAPNLGGIAYSPTSDTLWVLDPVNHELVEMEKSGLAGDAVALAIEDVVNEFGGPVLRGMAFHPDGNDGAGSLYIVETVGTVIYEVDLEGELIRSFAHPQDEDGFPGEGLAAAAGGIEVVLGEDGELLGLDLIGEVNGTPAVLRLDTEGEWTGLFISLAETGAGEVGGITRAPFVDPQNGNLFDALWGTHTSGAELFIVDGEPPPLAELTDLTCESDAESVTLGWTRGQEYDQIVVTRNHAVLATLDGDADEFTDEDLPDGSYHYTVYGEEDSLATLPFACSAVIGAGRVEAHLELDEEIRWVWDLTSDGEGNIWMTDESSNLHVYDADLEFLRTVASPVADAELITGIAYRPDTETLLVLNTSTAELVELDLDGEATGDAVALDFPVPDDEESPEVACMAYDPDGNDGDGLVYLVELTKSVVLLFDLEGTLLDSWTHPDELELPTPDPSGIDTFAWGVSVVPGVPGEIDIAGGGALGKGATRFLRVAGDSGEPTGFELTSLGIDRVGSVRYLSIHNTTYDDRPVAYVVSLRGFRNRLFRLDRAEPEVIPVTYLQCRQVDFPDEVEITFLNHGPYDAIELERDGKLLETLDGDADSYTDDDVTPGRHRYRVTPIVDDVAAESRTCELRVGKGALLRRAFLYPAFSVYQMTRSATDGSFVIASNSPSVSDEIFVFDSDLEFVEALPSPVEAPWLVAALGVRPDPAGDEIYSIGWEVPAPPGLEQEFEFRIQDADGEVIIGPTILEIPGPVGPSLTYPAAMAHDSGRDCMWFLERNSDTFWQMDLGGELLGSFPHPQPPVQNFVFNLGLSFDAVRNSFTATTAGLRDTRITLAFGMTADGIRTGEEISLDDTGMNPIYGLARANGKLWVCGSIRGISVMAELKAADPLAPPESLTCSEPVLGVVELEWESPEDYDELVIRRSGVEIATIAGTETLFSDAGAGAGPVAYTLAGRLGDEESSPSACSLVVVGESRVFLRGDVDENGSVSLPDALKGLRYMFADAEQPACLDTLDSDDSGEITLADPLRILRYLFAGGAAPRPPFPDPGADPTGDGLDCD